MILRLASDNPATIELLDDIGGIAQMLTYLKDTSNSKLYIEALDVAVCLSQTPRGRQVMQRDAKRLQSKLQLFTC